MSALLIALGLLLTAMADAQEWHVGKWSGTTPSSGGGGLDQREIIFKQDGTFSSNIQSVIAGLVTHGGACTFTDQTLRCKGTITTGPPPILGSPVEYMLSQKGDDLEGTISSTGRTRQVTLKRAK